MSEEAQGCGGLFCLPMGSAATDPAVRHWLRWAAEGGNTPMFVRRVAEAALVGCSPDYELLRPVLVELKRRHPEPSRSSAGFLSAGH